MTRLRRFWLLALPVLLFAAACNRAAVEDPAPVETTETASPTPSPTPDTFELEGVVLEASGSAQAANATQSPSPGGATPTESPDEGGSPGATASPAVTGEPTPAGEAPLFQNASPGSLALRLNSFSGAGPCVFNANDTVVVSFTGNTSFEPADVTENERFPNNLIRGTVRVTGDVLEPEEGCVLVARSITVTQASPSPTARARTGGTRTPTRSPSPRPASPTPSPTATTPSPAGGSPGAAGSPGA
jgi:hypothetical protein